jgi:dipeptidyl-peptidase-3
LSAKEHTLGLGEKGVTTYFSSNCTAEDSDKINRFFKEKGIEGYINRAIKTVKPV